MSILGIIGLIVGGIILLYLIGAFIRIYNSLVRLKNNIKKAWANIDVLLKQRHDELPKLLASVKGYMKHERGLLTEITKARTSVMSATTVHDKAQANGQLTNALKSLFAVAENYPDLKANQGFLQLQSRITGIEGEIADRREFYNDSVNTYNIRIASIPDNIIAGMLSYKEIEMFKVDEADKQDVKIEF